MLHDGTGTFAEIIETADQLTNKDAFRKMVRVKYQVPFDTVNQKDEWLEEVKKPINMTVKDIRKDLNKFISGFPK